MAQQLYFSRDTRMFVQFRNPADNTETAAKLGAGSIWEIPVLDGYSFSQTTNTSEITLAEMESTAGISRRGKRVFTDSLAPAEWSFSTYIRPFRSLGQNTVATGVKAAEVTTGTDTHAVEEVLWASMFGADTYTDTNSTFTRATNAVSGPVITPAAQSSAVTLAESNRSAMTAFTLWFLIDTATSNPLVYRLPEAVVNEASVDFDVDGIATLNWSGFAKEVQDKSGNVFVSATVPAGNSTARTDGGSPVLGDVWIDTDNALGRAFHLLSAIGSGSSACTPTQAIDEATTSTKNFIRNRLTSVNIEAADNTDKISTVFPGSYVTITGLTKVDGAVATAAAHGFAVGDVVYVSGTCGITISSVDVLASLAHTITAVTTDTFTIGGLDLSSGTSGSFSGTPVAANGKYGLTLTGGSFTLGNNITYLVPEELGAINKPLEHVTGTRNAVGNATCYMTLEDSDRTSGTSRQFFNDLVSTGAMAKTVNKFKVTMHVGGSTATGNQTDPALKIEFPTAHIEVPSHSIEDVISLETNFQALPTDFGAADEISAITYYPVDAYS